MDLGIPASSSHSLMILFADDSIWLKISKWKLIACMKKKNPVRVIIFFPSRNQCVKSI
jgi:hypothetical protein